MKESEMTPAQIGLLLFTSCATIAVAQAVIFRKVYGEKKRHWTYPSSADSELYKF